VKTLLTTIHVAIVGCQGNPVYRSVAWIPICVSVYLVTEVLIMWEGSMGGSHKPNAGTVPKLGLGSFPSQPSQPSVHIHDKDRRSQRPVMNSTIASTINDARAG
jgi:hypothetical protein